MTPAQAATRRWIGMQWKELSQCGSDVWELWNSIGPDVVPEGTIAIKVLYSETRRPDRLEVVPAFMYLVQEGPGEDAIWTRLELDPVSDISIVREDDSEHREEQAHAEQWNVCAKSYRNKDGWHYFCSLPSGHDGKHHEAYMSHVVKGRPVCEWDEP